MVAEKCPVSQPDDARQQPHWTVPWGNLSTLPWRRPNQEPPSPRPKPQQHFLRECLASPSLVLPSCPAHPRPLAGHAHTPQHYKGRERATPLSSTEDRDTPV